MDKNNITKLINFDDESVDSSTGFVSTTPQSGTPKIVAAGDAVPGFLKRCRDSIEDYVKDLFTNQDFTLFNYAFNPENRPRVLYRTKRGVYRILNVYGIFYDTLDFNKNTGPKVIGLTPVSNNNDADILLDDIEPEGYITILNAILDPESQKYNNVKID